MPTNKRGGAVCQRVCLCVSNITACLYGQRAGRGVTSWSTEGRERREKAEERRITRKGGGLLSRSVRKQQHAARLQDEWYGWLMLGLGNDRRRFVFRNNIGRRFLLFYLFGHQKRCVCREQTVVFVLRFARAETKHGEQTEKGGVRFLGFSQEF